MRRRAFALLCLIALGVAGCGGGDTEADHARKAAETYVHDLGARDGDAVCSDMTKALQSTPYHQLQEFSTAKIESVKVNGSAGSFVYRLRDLKVDGKVAQEGGAWKVSCCAPGPDGRPP